MSSWTSLSTKPASVTSPCRWVSDWGRKRIGASVYQAEAGVPFWPYHYHHGIEEWLYVIAGAPVLRDPAWKRVLAPGDLVCFPSGPIGAHTF